VLSNVIKFLIFTAEVFFSMNCFMLVLFDITVDIVKVIFKFDRNEIMNYELSAFPFGLMQ
jgi:hypothetical protein